MQIAILAVLAFLLICVLFLIWKIQLSGQTDEKVESVLNEKFINFSENIRNAMDLTRKEVERSKEMLSSNLVKTLENMNNMNRQIDGLRTQQEKAQELGQSLEYLLQAPKLRGNYGETVLEEMLERILPKGIWEKQYSLEDGHIVDAVVRYKDIIIPIDSKFPKEDYQKYLNEENLQKKRSHWSNHQKAVKNEIRAIRDKYIKPHKGTSDFALLFIPSESIYYECIAEKNHLGDPCDLYEYASKNKVIPVSPNTFYAFLSVIMLGIRNIEIASDALKIQESLSKIEKNFYFFYKRFQEIGKSLTKATESFRVGEKHLRAFKKKLDRTLKKNDSLKEDRNIVPSKKESSDSKV